MQHIRDYSVKASVCSDNKTQWESIAAGLAALVGGYTLYQSTSETCGIIGVVGKKPNANQILLEGLTVLQNRGYDSAGMCTISQNDTSNAFVTTKFANSRSSRRDGSTEGDSIAKLRRSADLHQKNTTGIAHTRWATHGRKIDANAHPHFDQHGRIAVAHNGSILNAHELRDELHSNGIAFRSDTDTEVIAQLIGYSMDQDPSLSTLDATKLALAKLTGTWGVVVLSKDSPDEMIVAQHGSPMVLGMGNEQAYAASELPAFCRHSDHIVELQDGEIAVIRADNNTFDKSRIRSSEASDVQVPSSPSPWPHWTLREIEEQPDAIYRALNFGARMTQNGVTMGGLARETSKMVSIQHLVLTCCGSSKNAAMYGARLFRSLDAFQSVQVVDGSSFSSSILPKTGAGLLAVSQSGETKTVLDALHAAQEKSIPCFSVVNGVGSRISQTTKIGAYQNAGPEMAVTSTKSFSTQVTVIALIACWFAQHRDNASEAKRLDLAQALQRLPSSFKAGLSTRPQCKDVAGVLRDAESCFVVGGGPSTAIAAEGALKLRELAYLHARVWSGPEDDSPLALVEDKDTSIPFIFLIFGSRRQAALVELASKLHRKGHPVIVITDNPKLGTNICQHSIVVSKNGPLSALGAITPLQLIAYELSLLRGYNPDVPRNLLKVCSYLASGAVF